MSTNNNADQDKDNERFVPNEAGSVSKLRFYSYGIVAAVKDLDTGQVEITPMEKYPYMDNELTDNMEAIEAKGKRADGSNYEAAAIITSTIPAVWAPIGDSNRFTAPDVRIGSKVIMLTFGDDISNMYWVTFTQDIAIRRLETVIYAFSGSPDGIAAGNKEESLNKCYFLEISSHSKHVVFQNSVANGEVTIYQLLMDFGKGLFRMGDREGNEIYMENDGGIIRLKNAFGVTLELNQEDFTLVVPGKGSMDITQLFSMRGGEGVSVASDSSIETNAPQTTLDSGVINLNGNVGTSGGSFGGDGRASFSGRANFEDEANFQKDVSIDGDLDVTGSIHSANLSVDNPPW